MNYATFLFNYEILVNLGRIEFYFDKIKKLFSFENISGLVICFKFICKSIKINQVVEWKLGVVLKEHLILHDTDACFYMHSYNIAIQICNAYTNMY